MDHEDREQRTLLRGAQRHRLGAAARLERSEDLELHSPLLRRKLPPVPALSKTSRWGSRHAFQRDFSARGDASPIDQVTGRESSVGSAKGDVGISGRIGEHIRSNIVGYIALF